MSNQYQPMLAITADAPFSSKDWIFEAKWDGIRAISYIDKSFSIRSRNGKEMKDNFPELEELRQLAPNTVLDGEIVAMKNGRADFQALMERAKSSSQFELELLAQRIPVTYIVFDILEKENRPLIDLSLKQRKQILKDTLKEGKHVLQSEYVEEDGIAYYEAAVKLGVEGIIAKKMDGRYKLGVRSGDWLKIKKVLTCDCVIFGYTRGEGSRELTFGALVLGLYNDHPVYVGKVGTGLSQKTLDLMIEAFRGLESAVPTLEGVDILEKITWLKPELACEVAYQTVTSDGRLRMPRFLRLRTDKPPRECTREQLEQIRLLEYTAKRDFIVTPEPSATQEASASDGVCFVVQEHNARRFHYDFRLEREGVLKSWAVPKGIPMVIGEKRLAVEVEDHPLEYGSFEGTIPEGEYGAGTVKIWDKGIYSLKIWKPEIIEFTLKGEKLQGRYVLIRLKSNTPTSKRNYILVKLKDRTPTSKPNP